MSVLQKYDEGFSMYGISRELGMPLEEVRYILIKNGKFKFSNADKFYVECMKRAPGQKNSGWKNK